MSVVTPYGAITCSEGEEEPRKSVDRQRKEFSENFIKKTHMASPLPLASQLARISVHGQDDEDFLLDYSGRGLKLDSEEDAQEIVNEINKCKKLKTLKLEGNTLGVNAAKCIAKALESHPEFERALWKDMFTGRLKTEIPEALMFLSSGLMLAKAQLVELDLSDNALGPIGIEGIQTLLQSPCCYRLQILRLNNNGLGISGGKMLAKALLECYRTTKASGSPLALHTFISGRNRLENEGAKALAQFFAEVQTLKEVMMPQNGIHAEGITALAEALVKNKNLTVLNLNDNTFVEKGSKAISKLISSLTHLEVLNFGDCLIRSEGAKVIASALKEGHENLMELNLGFNEIDKDGALAILDSIQNKAHLWKLDLDGNKFGPHGCRIVRSTLNEYNKLEILGSLSEDEEENEDDDEERRGEEDEDNAEDSNGKHPSPMKSKPLLISHIEFSNKEVTIDEFLLSPSDLKLKLLGKDGKQQLLKEIQDYEGFEKNVEIFFKIASCISTESNEVACEYADAVLEQAFNKADEKKALAALSNCILVHIGLIKSEDKQFKPVSDTYGSLVLLEHVVKQQYFSKQTKEILQLFLSRPNKAVQAYSGAKHKLLQSLYRF